MIFVCVGTSDDPFDRLLEIIDELCEKKIIKDRVVAQIGRTSYKPRNYEFFKMTEAQKFQEYLEKADYIISHAGIGCVLSAIKMEKKVIIFPRMKKYHEHVDDHQMEMMKAFVEKGYILGATDKKQLKQAVEKIGEFEPVKFVSNNATINNLVIDYIESLV